LWDQSIEQGVIEFAEQTDVKATSPHSRHSSTAQPVLIDFIVDRKPEVGSSRSVESSGSVSRRRKMWLHLHGEGYGVARSTAEPMSTAGSSGIRGLSRGCSSRIHRMDRRGR